MYILEEKNIHKYLALVPEPYDGKFRNFKIES